MSTQISLERYQRQLILKDFGLVAQEKLAASSILIIGLGGLGCPAVQYLMGSGVKHIGLVDGDRVSLSNLHRQLMYTENDIGKLKAEVLQQRINDFDASIDVSVHAQFISQENALLLLSEYEIVLDCTDNFLSRYIINDACVLLKKPLVFGAIFQYEGQLSVFNVGVDCINYRDIYPECPIAFNCNEAGVFPMIAGIIGTMLAGEAIKLIVGIGEIAKNKLVNYNALNHSMYIIDLSNRRHVLCSSQESSEAFKNYDYRSFCHLSEVSSDEITASTFDQLMHTESLQIIDIRMPGELPLVTDFQSLNIPLLELPDQIHRLDRQKKIVLFCHSGIRTQKALTLLQDEYQLTNICHLKGGILKWIQYKSRLHERT